MRTLKAHQISALAFLTVREIFSPKMLSFRKEEKEKKKNGVSLSLSTEHSNPSEDHFIIIEILNHYTVYQN